jgi:hypothetical protein
MKASAIAEATIDTLKAELGTLEAVYNKSEISFKNSKGEIKTCAINLIDRLGRYAGPDDAKVKQAYLDVYFKSTHEAKKAADSGCDVRLSAGNSVKAGVRVTSTVKGIEEKSAPVSAQFAAAQKIAKSIHAIREEIDKRIDRRNAAEKAAEKAAELNKAVLEALMGPAPAPVQAPAALELVA